MWTSPVFCASIPSIMTPGSFEWQLLLKQVSRSFYLTLYILPRSVRKQISLAYLLARATDTIADTPIIEARRKQEALLQLQKGIQESCEGGPTVLPNLGDLAEAQEKTAGEGTAAERMLLQNLGELLRVVRTLPMEDRQRIRKVLDTIIRGQETDLVRFRGTPGSLDALDTDEELDRYTYDVAGCVGEFWTEMCRAHVIPVGAILDDRLLMKNGVLFGKGLQLVNILRDIPKDLRRGRCYIPRSQLAEYGLEPRDLLDWKVMDRFRPIYNSYLARSADHLSAGWEYTTALPFRCIRIRLACAWPLLIGAQTLEKLRMANVLDETQRVKVSRSEIRRLLLRSVLLYPNPKAWSRIFPVAAE